MKSVLKGALSFILFFYSFCAVASNLWKPAVEGQLPRNQQLLHPAHFLVYTVDEAILKLQLWNLSSNPADGIIITLPLPDGSFREFKVWQTSLMPDALAARYPDIKSFSGVAVDDQRVTAKLDFTVYGFDAMIFDGDNTSFIDPYDNYHDGFYMVHYKKDETRGLNDRMQCLVKEEGEDNPAGEPIDLFQSSLPKLAAKTVNGWTLRTYRLALSANSHYCQAATGLTSPTIVQAFSKMTTTMNRVNGVYNREFSVQMTFCANEDTLIWPTATGSVNGNDPFNTINLNATSCMSANQTQCTNRIGSANYDLGHVFTTGAGGQSALGVVCNSSQKARSVTGRSTPVGDGFDIDYVSHEMGHEFGASHTFNNNNDGSCSGNASSSSAYEPGSGATIMAYAGICPPDNLQPNSDPYFHARSLNQVVALLNGAEGTCAANSATGNKLVYLAPFTASYTIPYKTPFEFAGPVAVDSVADTLITYCWEQWNRGDFGNRLITTFQRGPIFRSYNPVIVPSRIFPKLSMVLAGVLSNAGINNAEGEKVPDTTRYLTFKMTVRNIINGYGCITFPDDTLHVDAISTGAANGYAGFKVTSQGAIGLSYIGGSPQTITWNVAGSDAAPVNAANVDIYMSEDGGNTWPHSIGTFPNTGSASINVPNPATTTTTARFKVKGSGNIFFNINGKNFTVSNNPGVAGIGAQATVLDNNIKVFPVPASDILNIKTTNANALSITVYNTIGQIIWTGVAEGSSKIATGAWARGLYYLRFTDTKSGAQAVKRVTLQ